jgi:putative PIN family toxin of toxin-antitoxin system
MLPTDNVTRLGDGSALVLPNTRPDAGRVVLDTNTVLDWLLFGEPLAVAVGTAIAEGQLRWLATPRIVAELRSVLVRPLAARWESTREHVLTIDVAPLITMCAEPAPAAADHLICRDRNDQVFIDLALAHSPTTLLTRDRALLALRRRAAARGVVITTASAWRPLPLAG